ncbi:hypothetical protein ABIE44_000502 [Marmoricola sp. OAE513]|uniref:hypothetical protein n=1 Tax=Marmoricola sp. OAE513 TaxID=2817894 RepID=UPI001AE6F48F
MSDESRILAGTLFLSLVTVETGGLYLVKLWKDASGATPFQIGFARAGHAHAGVLLVLGLLCQLYVDAADLSGGWEWVARVGVPAAALLMPAGFFAASAGPGRTGPNRFIALVYAGGAVMALGLGTLGVGLLLA